MRWYILYTGWPAPNVCGLVDFSTPSVHRSVEFSTTAECRLVDYLTFSKYAVLIELLSMYADRLTFWITKYADWLTTQPKGMQIVNFSTVCICFSFSSLDLFRLFDIFTSEVCRLVDLSLPRYFDLWTSPSCSLKTGWLLKSWRM